MKLYYTKGACSLVPRIIINELNLSCDYESVNLTTKKTEKGEDFLTINPKGQVPTLVTDEGEILTENAVILQYLAEKESATNLLPPPTDFKRYRVLEWVNYITTELHKGIAPLFNPNISDTIKNQLFIPQIQAKLSSVDKRLEHNYLIDNEFTLPDAYLFVILNWVMYFKLNMQEWPHLTGYHARLKKRESILNALIQEGLVSTHA